METAKFIYTANGNGGETDNLELAPIYTLLSRICMLESIHNNE